MHSCHFITFESCLIAYDRGIGAATAQAYAKAGATGLILTSRTTSALEGTKQDILAVAKKPDLKIVVVAMEVQDEAATQKLSKTIEAEFGRLDVLVNNAGVLATDAAMFNEFDQVPMDQVHAVTDVNYIGKMLSCKYLIPLLLASDNGAKSIVNITSMSSLEPHFLAAFGISELAVNRLTEHLANQYKDRGLLVYALHPGTVKSTPPPGTPSMFLEAMIDDLGLAGSVLYFLCLIHLCS